METTTPQTLTLADGRLLEHATYGDPDGAPVMFFHGFIGSLHQVSFAAQTARQQRVHLVAVNRPGVGRSTPADRRRLDECVPDVRRLADFLGWGRFAVVGVSGGAPYALACLKGLPGRAVVAVLASGLGPVGEPRARQIMGPFPRQALSLSRRAPALLRWIFRTRLRSYYRDPEGFLSNLVRTWARSDQQLFTRPEVRRFFLNDLHEVLVPGTAAAGLVQELRLYQNWGFRLEDVPASAQVVLWHGQDDVLVPPAMSEYVASRLPAAQVVFRPGGHFMMVDHAGEMVQELRGLLAEAQLGREHGGTRVTVSSPPAVP